MPLTKDSKPFIHGSSSSVLALLPYTEFMLYSPVWMMNEYQIAPIGGEIVGGGLRSIEAQSELAFGVASPEYLYNLKRIRHQYAIPAPLQQKEDLIKLARNNIKRAPHSLFSEINVLLIYLTRLKQIDVPNSEWLSETEIASLHQQANATLQFFYFLLLLGKSINLDYEKVNINKGHESPDLADAIRTHLSADLIVKKIIATQLDIRSICENPNPTHEMLQRVADLLKLPNKLSVKHAVIADLEREVTLTETSVFRPMRSSYSPPDTDTNWHPDDLARYVCANGGTTISDFLSGLTFAPKPSQEFFDTFHSVVLNIIQSFTHRLRILDTILSKEPTNILNTPHRELIANSFPIILITERREKLLVVGNEFRARTPLKLGEDITMIATDSPANQKQVQAYLHENKLHTVAVITFDELEAATNPKRQSTALSVEKETSSQPGQTVAVAGSSGIFAAVQDWLPFFRHRADDMQVVADQENDIKDQCAIQ